MRILHVSSLWPPTVLGGAEIYASQLANELIRAGHEVGLVTFGVAPELIEQPVDAACVTPWPYPLEKFADQRTLPRAIFRVVDLYNPLARKTIVDTIRSFRPDVVHSHSVIGLSTCALTVPYTEHSPHVHHLHDYWLMCRRTTMTNRSGTQCLPRCTSCRALTAVRNLMITRHTPDLLLAPSAAIAEFHANLGWARGRIRHLSHPVPIPLRPVNRPCSRPRRQVVFGYLGQLTREKGVETLLRAFSGLADQGHQLLVGGQGPLLSEVERSGSQIRALGWLDNTAKAAFFEEIDCLVVPSQWPEIGPLVALEARAYGVPVIGARIGAIPEHIDPSTEELLFRPADPGELRSSLQRFVSDPGRYKPSGETPIGWPEHLESILGFYEEAMRARAGKS